MTAKLPLRAEQWRTHFAPGERVAVAVSGGADSVALLRLLAAAQREAGLVVSAAHVHHGIRGAEADRDAEFVADLAGSLGVGCRLFHVDAAERAAAEGETLEEAARTLRYRCFRELLAGREADAVATAHTLDDQAETVLMRWLRGAWTEGLGGIHPVLQWEAGRVVRPLLQVERRAVEAYLRELRQPWREDASNADPAFTRNRVRHALLPALREYNPQIAVQLARMAAVARDEEAWWEAELGRVLPTLLLPGKAVRGGGRAASTHPEEAAVALEVERLRGLAGALRRRVVRAAGKRLGASLSFDQVESLLVLAGLGQGGPERPAGRGAVDLPGGLRAERTPRELRLSRVPDRGAARGKSAEARPEASALPAYEIPVPGRTLAPEYGLKVVAEVVAGEGSRRPEPLVLRPWQPGDRVRLRHSRGAKKVAEALDRLRVFGPERRDWPVVRQGREVLWIRGVEVDPAVLTAAGVRLVVREAAMPDRESPPAGHPLP